MANILIIEDDEFLRGLISKKLFSENFAVSVAADGKEGIKKIIKEKPDLVLLDLILPGIDGFEVLQKIKKEEATATTRIIVLSNMDQKEEIDRAIKLGAEDYFIKAQMTPDEIVEKIKTLFSAQPEVQIQ